MYKRELLKLAEAGVRQELREMQTRLNELHRHFPHLVANADGTIPSVLPIEYKHGRDPFGPAAIHKAAREAASGRRNGKRHPARGSGRGSKHRAPGEALAAIEAFLNAHAPATAHEIASHLGVHNSAVNKIVRANLRRFNRERITGVRGIAYRYSLAA